MRFVSSRRKATDQQSISGNVTEKTSTNHPAMCSLLIIQSGRAQMFKTATFEINLIGSNHPDSRSRSSQPSLVIQRMIQIIPLHLRFDAVTVCEIHPCLERNMTFFGRTHPGSIRESDVFKANIRNRTIQRSCYLHQCLNGRDYHLRISRLHLLSCSRIIIDFTAFYIVVPFSGHIQQFTCIDQIESGIMSVRRNHWTGPGMFKLYPALRLMKTYGSTVPLYFDRTNAKICHAPHLMKNHFGIFGL